MGTSIATIRQLFNGLPKPDLIERLERYSYEKENLITLVDLPAAPVWHFTKMGIASRYRYKLQN